MNDIVHPQTAGLPVSRWCRACALGELLGLGGAFALLAAASAAGANGFDQATPPAVRAALGALVGALEGGALGTMQALALKSALPHLPVKGMARATALPAALVWAAALALMNPGGPAEASSEPPMTLIALAGALGGFSGGILIGACQAFALAPAVGWHRARLWVVASATGWAAGLAVIMVATTLQAESTPAWQVAGLVIIGAVLGGSALGLGSYWGVRRVTAKSADQP